MDNRLKRIDLIRNAENLRVYNCEPVVFPITLGNNLKIEVEYVYHYLRWGLPPLN